MSKFFFRLNISPLSHDLQLDLSSKGHSSSATFKVSQAGGVQAAASRRESTRACVARAPQRPDSAGHSTAGPWCGQVRCLQPGCLSWAPAWPPFPQPSGVFSSRLLSFGSQPSTSTSAPAAAKPPHGLTQGARRQHDARWLTDLSDFRVSIGSPASSGGGADAFAPRPPLPLLRRCRAGPRGCVRSAPAHRPTLWSQDRNPSASMAAAERLGEEPGPGVLVQAEADSAFLDKHFEF